MARQNHGPQAAVIRDLNPVIRGWARYYRTVVASKVFAKEDALLFIRLRRWARRRHGIGRHMPRSSSDRC